MRNDMNILLKIGIVTYGIYGFVNYVITPLPHFIAMLILFASVSMMLIGAFNSRWHRVND